MAMNNAGISSGGKIRRAGFFWNAVYAGLNAVQPVILLFAVSRTHDLPTAGIFTIALAVGNLAAVISRYGLQNYQVTDVREQFAFRDYFLSRIISAAGTALLLLGYLALMLFTGKYGTEKTLVVLEVILLRIAGSVEEVYASRLQQKGRLDAGARIASVRLGGSTLVIFAALWVIPSVPLCLLLGLAAAVLADIALIPQARKYADFSLSGMNPEAAKRLLKTGLPLCAGLALHNYAGNAPKYLVDLYLSDELQAVCGYIMMPVSALILLNFLIMQPAVRGLGDAWNTDRPAFRQKVVRHMLFIAALTAVMIVAGCRIGLPVLSGLYGVDLRPYQKEFMILVAGGSLFTVSSYQIVLLTTMRRQRGVLWGCGAAVLVYLALGGTVSRQAGFTGACVLYVAANLLMAAVFLLFLLRRENLSE